MTLKPRSSPLCQICTTLLPSLSTLYGNLLDIIFHCGIQITSKYGFCFVFFNYIYLFMAVLGLRFCARAFSSCGKWGPLFIAMRGPLTITASLVAGHRLQTRRLSQLWLTGLVAPRHVGSSQTRARTHVPCIGRQTPNHCATREASVGRFLITVSISLLVIGLFIFSISSW